MKDNWTRIKLGDIFDFSNGLNFSKDSYKSGIKLISVSNFKDYFYPNYKELEEIDERVVKDSNLLKNGDIVFVRSNGNKNLVGRCLLVDNMPTKVTYSGFCIRARLKDLNKYNYLFFTYYFKSSMFRKSISNSSVGTNIQNLNQGLLSNNILNCPLIESQTKIANILNSYDSLIENNKKQIKLLEEAAEKLYKEWFIKLNYPNHENEEVVDELPNGWKRQSITDIKYFIQVSPGIEKFEGQKKYFATADINNIFIEKPGELISFNKRPSRASIQPCENSIWFARMSNSYKILCIYGESSGLSKKCVISSGFAGFSAKTEYFGFLYGTITSKYFNQEKNRYATGSTQVSITNEGLSRIKINIPPENLIKNYSKIVDNYIKNIEILKKQINLLQEARDKLLPKLMNGEIEV